MLKKILSLFLVLCLCACGTKQEEKPAEDRKEETTVEKEYIDPVKDVFIFGEIDEKLKERIRIANCDQEYKNYQFKMLDIKSYEGELTDINGDRIDLSNMGRFLMEIVSVECSHCKRQLGVIKELSKSTDIPIVQYFNVGDKDEIISMYREQGIDIPADMIIIAQDEGLKDYTKNTLQLKSYPTLLCFDEGVLTFDAVGEVNEQSFAAILDLGFENKIRDEDLTDKDGNDLRKLSRSRDDVKNDLSEKNLTALQELDNDDFTCDMTFSLMGQKLDFERLVNDHSELYFEQIGDYSYYKDKKLVLFYTYLRDNSETDKVEFINSLISQDDEYEYVVVLVEGMESSSAALRNMDVMFRCPVVSVLARMPEDFFDFGLNSFPSAVFVDEGTFTGAYSNIEDKEKFDRALTLFLSNECIAYKSNNQMSNG